MRLHHGRAVRTQPESVGDNARLFRVRFVAPVVAAAADKDVRAATLDELHRPAEPVAALARSAAADVELLNDLDELEAVSLASGSDTLALLGGRDEAFAVAVTDTRDANDADRASRGGMNGR